MSSLLTQVLAADAALKKAASRKRKSRPGREYVYLVQPRSTLCNRMIAEYLAAAGLADESKRSVTIKHFTVHMWVLPLDFIEQLNEERKKDLAGLQFNVYRHPKDDPNAIGLCRLFGRVDNPLLRKAKRDLDRVMKGSPHQSKRKTKR